MTADDNCAVLVLGGMGFLGRHFVHYLFQNNFATYIRVVDKTLPETAFLDETHKKMFTEIEYIEFMQKNLADPVAVAECMKQSDGSAFDYVFNFAGESRYSQASEAYETRICKLSLNCANEAAQSKVKVFVQMSTAEVYKYDQKQGASTEASRVDPSTKMAQYHYRAEEELKRIEGLNLVILRPAFVYGPGALLGLTPGLILGRIYQKLGDKLFLLGSKEHKMSTVHVEDVARACWHVSTWFVDNPNTPSTNGSAPIFNLADKQNTDQGKITELLRSIYGIDTGYHDSVLLQYVQANLEAVTEKANTMHLQPWADILEESDIKSSPLTPFMDEESVYKAQLSVDGTKIEEIGFSYLTPTLTEDRLLEITDGFKALGIWPRDECK